MKSTVLVPLAAMQSATDRVADALAGAHAGWIVLALCLHIGAQVARGLGWHRALGACWPDVGRRRACAWYVCGAGLTGVLSSRGGDAVRLALAKRELPGSTWPALAGTAVVEAGAQLLVGLPTLALALAIGVDAARPPSPLAVAGIAAALAVGAILAARSRRARGLLQELVRGCSALRHPRRDMSRIVGWEFAGKLLRFAAVGCFLHAFGLTGSLAAVVTVGVVYGSANFMPIPGAGMAASAGALLVALPTATGHSVDPSAVSALVIAQPLLLTAAGVTVSLALLAVLLGVRTPGALLRSGRALIAQSSAAVRLAPRRWPATARRAAARS